MLEAIPIPLPKLECERKLNCKQVKYTKVLTKITARKMTIITMNFPSENLDKKKK